MMFLNVIYLLPLLSTNSINSVKGNEHNLKKFAASFIRCPYASEWLTKGPEQALHDLQERQEHGTLFNFESHRKLITTLKERKTEDGDPVMGSCVYTNTWTNAETCIEYRGAGWLMNITSMIDHCNQDSIQGTVTEKGVCDIPESNMAGWCVKKIEDGMMEATLMELSIGMGCDTVSSVCASFAGGDYFEAAGECLEEGFEEDPKYEEQAVEESSGSCGIAPGPIGAAHQNGYSTGY